VKTLKNSFPTVAFGTSGVRALVSDLTPNVVRAYVVAFMNHLSDTRGMRPKGRRVVVGMDLRPSSPVITAVICDVLARLGYSVEFAGRIPTPALAFRCLQNQFAGVMVTGSHIPFDRNGLKFYSPHGEILKEDEEAISASIIDQDICSGEASAGLPEEDGSAAMAYVRRYVDHWGPQALRGLRVGLYEHSAVGRELTRRILEELGAEVIGLGRSDDFIPVDTEAVSDAAIAQARYWCAGHRLSALISTDGDGDRPLVFDENGDFIRGDLLGLISARALGIRALAVPVSCNTAIERCGAFRLVVRTRIGSPYVVAVMRDLVGKGESVAGFEANGGFLLGTPIGRLAALPTRDALLPIVTLLATAAAEGRTVGMLKAGLPARFTHSDRIQGVPVAVSKALLQKLVLDVEQKRTFYGRKITRFDTLDGLRVELEDGKIVHLRPSGNAPELRCYAEAECPDEAKALVSEYLDKVRRLAKAGAEGILLVE
jgi:phosphomannomutase